MMHAHVRASRSRTVLVSTIAIITALYVCFLLSGDSDITFLRLRQALPMTAGRITNWDWKDTAEETFCRNRHGIEHRVEHAEVFATNSKSPIPNIAHFILLSLKDEMYEMTYARYLAIKAAVLRLDATEIKVHIYENGLNINNTWWQQISDHVTLVPRRRPAFGPQGMPIEGVRLEHQSDMIRLSILAHEGGIYLDTDVYVLKPFTDLLSSPRDVLMGHEGANRFGLCNAVILSRPDSTFISEWRASYRTFNPRGWNEHSVQKPKQLQIQNPDLICPLSPVVFFWPTWAKKHIRYMHEPITQAEKLHLQGNMTAFDGAMYEDQLALHAWGTEARDYLPFLTPDTIQEDTRFNVLLRDIAIADLGPPPTS